MGLRSDVILPLLDMLRQQTELLTEWRETSYPDFLKNVERQHAVKHSLLLAIQMVLDISSHVISAAGAGVPTEYREMPLTLGRLGILPQDLAERLADAAGFRNLLVHGYKDIILERVYESLHEDLGDFDQFAQHIYNFLAKLESQEGRP
jgi:uncharacterized protein YutE (UPF0331/DUF86 family)